MLRVLSIKKFLIFLATSFLLMVTFYSIRKDNSVMRKRQRIEQKRAVVMTEFDRDDILPLLQQRKVIDTNGNFMSRLQDYITAVIEVSEKIRSFIGPNASWQRIAWKLDLLNGEQPGYIEKLGRYGFVHGVFLRWKSPDMNRTWSSLRDPDNVLVNQYYDWTCDKNLYSWISKVNKTKPRYGIQYNKWCQRNISEVILPRSIEPVYFNMRELVYLKRKSTAKSTDIYSEYNHVPDYVFYMHIFTHGIVTRFGYVISRYLKVVPLQCQSNDYKRQPPRGYKNATLYGEVFVIAQFWGEGYYHRNMEMLPRIAPYINFLQKYTHIKIHTTDESKKMMEFLSILGLDPGRITKGDIRAKIIYLPKATGCGGSSQVQATQLLSKHFRDYAVSTFGKPHKKSIVFVKRSYRRRMLYHDDIFGVLKNIAKDYDLDIHNFDDMDLPNLSETIRIFNKASVIVGPHGAGLSNMLFSEPGTLIMEGLCDRPHLNLCFQMGAHVLGHMYHGIPSVAKDGCLKYIHIKPEVLDKTLRKYLDLINGR